MSSNRVNDALRVFAFETLNFGHVVNSSGVNGKDTYEVTLPPHNKKFSVLVDRRSHARPYKEFTVFEAEGDHIGRPLFSFITSESEHIHTTDDHVTDDFLRGSVFGEEHYEKVADFQRHLTRTVNYVPRHYYDGSFLANLRKTYTTLLRSGEGYAVYGPVDLQGGYLVHVTDHVAYVEKNKEIEIADGIMLQCYPIPMHQCYICHVLECVQYRGLAFFYALLSEGDEEAVLV